MLTAAANQAYHFYIITCINFSVTDMWTLLYCGIIIHNILSIYLLILIRNFSQWHISQNASNSTSCLVYVTVLVRQPAELVRVSTAH